MNLKTTGIVCFFVLIGAWALVHAQATSQSNMPAGANGRYQVVAAEIDYSSMGSNLKYKTAIRVDTQTGQTWELTEVDDAKTHGAGFYWVKSNESR
jgi:hypothetical protein